VLILIDIAAKYPRSKNAANCHKSDQDHQSRNNHNPVIVADEYNRMRVLNHKACRALPGKSQFQVFIN